MGVSGAARAEWKGPACVEGVKAPADAIKVGVWRREKSGMHEGYKSKQPTDETEYLRRKGPSCSRVEGDAAGAWEWFFLFCQMSAMVVVKCGAFRRGQP